MSWASAIIGFGCIGRGYAADPIMARHYPYAAHAQVLAQHPAFEWRAVVDPDLAAQTEARQHWGVSAVAADVASLGTSAGEIEFAVLATAPDTRLGIIETLPRLRAVLVEKPLGTSMETAHAFLDACAARGVMVAVNLWRRADTVLRDLAAGALTERIGALQGGIALYGNGLRNNGTHVIDMVRMLSGEIAGGTLIGVDEGFIEGPIPYDRNPSFALHLAGGVSLAFQPLRFAEYRENGLILWGTRGRIEMMNEGLSIASYPRAANRAMQGEHEIAFDAPEFLPSGAGTALYAMYDNLADALAVGDPGLLTSTGSSALATARVVEAVAQLAPVRPTFALEETAR